LGRRLDLDRLAFGIDLGFEDLLKEAASATG
jgi:hypothetical protein